jgi:serine/threonine-protein kinase
LTECEYKQRQTIRPTIRKLSHVGTTSDRTGSSFDDASSLPTRPDVASVPPTDPLGQMLCADQRLRWQQGQRVPVEAYFEHYADLKTNSIALKDLVAGEIDLRRELHEPLDFSAFCMRFPDLIDWLRLRFDRLRTPDSSDDTEREDDESEDNGAWPDLPGFRVLEVIGRGGVGRVFRAHEAKLNRIVALKTLLAGAHAGPKAVARFRTEAEAVARLQHPFIVQIFDIIEHHDQLILSLEYVGGGSLAKRIAGRPQPIREAAECVSTLAQAVQYAHDRGIVHRDLKPGNILLTDDGIPKIADFGLAKRMDDEGSHTKTGTVLGTPDYMAPEQAEGKTRDIGPPTDIYALGIILYEMLIGRPPFRNEAMIQVLDAVRFNAPTSLRQLRPDVPKDLETICLRCLEKTANRRYPSALELAEDLKRFLNGQPIKARPSGFWSRIRSWFGG